MKVVIFHGSPRKGNTYTATNIFMKKKRPYTSSVFMYYLNRFIIKKFVGEGNYPFEYWKENGYFEKCPF